MKSQILYLIIAVLAIGDIIGLGVALFVMFPSGRAVLGKLSWLSRCIYRLFGVPDESEIVQYRDDLWGRYTGDRPDAQTQDRALTYIERVVDRQINKARGILPFNSILLVINGLELFNLKNAGGVAVAALLKNIEHLVLTALAISSIILLEFFSARWPKTPSAADFKQEFTDAVLLSRKRAISLNMAIILSVLSLLGLAAVGVVSFP
jgi:hypothetical protein